MILKGDKFAYRDEVQGNKLILNSSKTKELIKDLGKNGEDAAPLIINGDCVERVHSFKFLAIRISQDMSRSTNIMAEVKKAHQRLYFLRIVRKNNFQAAGVLLPFCR